MIYFEGWRRWKYVMTHFQISKRLDEEYSKAVFYAHCFLVLLSFFLFFISVILFFFFFVIFLFIHDLLPQIKTVQLNMYAEDGQLHTNSSDLVPLEGRISLVVNSANACYENNRTAIKPLFSGNFTKRLMRGKCRVHSSFLKTRGKLGVHYRLT